MRFVIAAAVLLSSSLAFAQSPNCSAPAPQFGYGYSAPAYYGAPAPVGGILDSTIDSALDRFAQSHDLAISINRRQPSGYGYGGYSAPAYGAPVYSAPVYSAAPVYAAPPVYAAAPVYAAPVVPAAMYQRVKVYPSGKMKVRTWQRPGYAPAAYGVPYGAIGDGSHFVGLDARVGFAW